MGDERRRCRGGRVRRGRGLKNFDYLTLKFLLLFNLEMVYFGAHLRYSDELILKLCVTQCKLKMA